jgi:hypothetical protein
MLSSILIALFACFSLAYSISVIDNTELDPAGIYFVSYDGLVNINSFQLSAVLTYNGYQYAGWYTSSRVATLARRSLPSGSWQKVQLNHSLKTNDSHDVISLGVSPEDGVLHVVMDCHSDPMFYTKVSLSSAWSASSFSTVVSTLGNLNIGRLGASF